MLIKIITLKFNSVYEKFDDTEVFEFIKNRDIVSVREYFFLKDETPYLTLVIHYRPASVENAAGIVVNLTKNSKEVSKGDESWRKLLDEKDVPLFSAMRDWRMERSKKEGIPPYIICTNRQLADIVKNKPDSFAGLEKINGFGKAKIDKYGADMLALLNPTSVTPSPQ